MPHRRRRPVAKRSQHPAQLAQPGIDVMHKSEPLTADNVTADNVVTGLMSAVRESAGADSVVILPLADSRKRPVPVGARDAGLSNAALTHFLDMRTAYPTEFVMRWVKSPAREVIADYERHGGDRRLLFLILWQLQLPEEADTPYPARVIRALRRACGALEAALKATPLRRGRPITRDVNLRMMIQFELDRTRSLLEDAQRLADRRRERGRPAGITRRTLFTAVLASEFEHVFGRPQMRAIAKLLGSNEAHVRRLVDHAKRADVDAHLRFLRTGAAP